MRLRLLVLLLVAIASGTLAGVDPKAPSASPLAAPAPAGNAAVSARRAPACPVPPEFGAEFEAAADDTELPLALLVAVGTVESNLRPDARSPAGAHGLLQVLAAYDAGPSAVERGGAEATEETVLYVGRVTDEWRRLVGCA